MSRGLEAKVGEEQFRQLMKSMTVPEMAVLLCTHHALDKDRKKCKACRRAIYRAIKRVQEKEKAEKTFQPIQHFDKIPEIQTFIEFQKAKGAKWKAPTRKLERMWQWVRESPKLSQKQRPIMWDIQVVKLILSKVNDLKISKYQWVQALRQFFHSQERYKMVKDPLLRARRKDQRAPHAKKRIKDFVSPPEFQDQVLAACDTEDQRLALRMHVTLKAREGSQNIERDSFLGLRWENVIWEDAYYGEPSATIAVYEPKTGGGTTWLHCRLDLFFKNLPQQFRDYWTRQGAPKKGRVWKWLSYQDYLRLFKMIREKTGLTVIPHDMRRSGATWLHNIGLDSLAIGQYNPGSGDAIGFGGVGWENAEIYFQRYGKMSFQPTTEWLKAFEGSWCLEVRKRMGFMTARQAQ